MKLADLYPAILTIVVIGMVLGAGIYSLSTFRTNILTDYTGTDNGNNVSTGTLTLSDSSNTNYLLSSLDSVTYDNGTPITNYTYTNAGVITWGADVVATGNLANVTSTYTYDAEDKPEAALSGVITGTGDFADWIPIITVIIAAAIVLGVVLSSFGKDTQF